MTEIEEVKAQIKVLEKKLSFLEELEKTKSPVEEAYKKVYGNYPDTGIGTGFSYVYWDVFQKAYEQAQKDYKVGEFQEPEEEPEEQVSFIKELVKEGIKWCEEHPNESVEDWLKPQTHQQVADGLKEAFREAVKQGVVSSVDKPKKNRDDFDEMMDDLVEKFKKDPPPFLRFELGKTLEQLIERWWCDVFSGPHEKWSMEECIHDLIDQVELWLPREGSTAGSQDTYACIAVDAENDLLKKIKSKLRNKKDT